MVNIIILISFTLLNLFILFLTLKNNNLESFTTNDLNSIKQEIDKQYNMDIEAIRNLGAISKSLLTGKNYHNNITTSPGVLTIPSNVKISGKLDVIKNLNVKSNNFNILPKGMIMAWAYTNIPAGWAKCDGTNGTPDLKSRFILGEGRGGGLTNRPRGQRSGSETHTLTAAQLPAHSHQYISHYGGRAKVNDNADGNEPADDPHYDKTHNTTNTGSNQPHNNMPPYHVLIYIMKL